MLPPDFSPPRVPSSENDAVFFLAAIVDSSQDSIITIDFNGIITTWNRAAEELYGYPAAEAIGRPLTMLTLPAELQMLLGNIEKVKENRKVEVFDSVRVNKDGHEMTLEVVMSPVKNTAGKVIGVSTIARDVTRAREMQKAQVEREEQFRRAIEDAPIPVIMHAEDGEVLQISRTWTQLTGYTLEDVPTLDAWLTRAYGEGADAVRDRIRELFKDDQASGSERRINMDFPVRTRGNELRHWSFSASSPGTLEDGRRFIVGMAVDITERQQAEATLHEAEERYRLLVEGVKDYAMFLMDPQRRIFHWNTGAERIFGFSRAEAVGASGDIIFTAEDRAAGVPDAEAQAAMSLSSSPDVRWHQRKDGSLLWANGLMTALWTEEGDLRGFAKIARDATKEREAEEELRLAHDDLEKRVQERTQKLQVEVTRREEWETQRTQLMQRIVEVQEDERKRISRELHDNLGQYATAIKLSLAALQHDEESLPLGERRANVPRIAALQEQMDELLSITHRLAWELRPATLDNVGLEAALRQYVQEWNRHGVVADFASRFPEGANQAPGRAETGLSPEAETALYRVVQEALTNVLRHAHASQVSVVLERQGRLVSAIVEDNGKGFDVGAAANSKRLGVRGMAERMELVGGTLEVESQPGIGTTVYARVPF